MPRPAGGRSTRQSDWKPVEAVKVSTVLVDVAPEPMDSADSDTIGMLPLVRQAVLAGLNFCDLVVGGPTPTFLSSAGSWTLLEVSPSGWHPRM